LFSRTPEIVWKLSTRNQKYSNVKSEEWILSRKTYQTGFTGSSGQRGLRPKSISPQAKKSLPRSISKNSAAYLTRANNPVNPACPMESFLLIPSGSIKEFKNRILSTLSTLVGKKYYG